MSFDSQIPYNELPELPPRMEIETKPVLRKAIAAARSLAELKQAGDLLPDASVLINTIPLLEAHDSSEIENVVTTADELFRLASREEAEADPSAKEAYRYRTALNEGFRGIQKRPVNTNTAIRLCGILLDQTIGIRNVPGVRIGNRLSREIIYTPPEGEDRIRSLLSNWERYFNEEREVDPLIRLAVMHYQFEAIHPFADGNGRTGRILNILFLIQEQLLSIPVLYLSRYILANRGEYYGLLHAVTANSAWEPWILYMLDALEQTAQWTTRKITGIRALMDHTTEYIREQLPKIYSRELCELIFRQPYSRIGNLVDGGVAKRQTASIYLKGLVGIGVLREEKAGRDKLFVHPKFLHLLTSDENTFEPYGPS